MRKSSGRKNPLTLDMERISEALPPIGLSPGQQDSQQGGGMKKGEENHKLPSPGITGLLSIYIALEHVDN